jgi:hypothetical protein
MYTFRKVAVLSSSGEVVFNKHFCYKPTENAPLCLELLWMYYDNDDDDDGTFVCFYCFLVSYVISLYFQYSIQKLFVLKRSFTLGKCECIYS